MTFYIKENNEKFYTNLIKINEKDFSDKIINSNKKNIGFLLLNEKDYEKSGRTDYIKLNGVISNKIKEKLDISSEDKYSVVKYKSITIDKQIFVFFITNKPESDLSDIISFIKSKVTKTHKENLEFKIASEIFQLLLKIEILNLESDINNKVESFMSNELNNDIRFLIRKKSSKDKIYYNTLKTKLLINKGVIATEIVSEKYRSDGYENEKNTMLLIDKNVEKFPSKKVEVNFLEVKKEKQRESKLYYYQLVDTIIKNNILDKLGIKYENHYFDLNYTVKGQDKIVTNILDKEYLETVIIDNIDRRYIDNNEYLIYKNVLNFLMKNSDDLLCEKFKFNKNEYLDFLNNIKVKLETPNAEGKTPDKKAVLKETKLSKLKITDIISAKDVKFEDLKKGVNYLILNHEAPDIDTSFMLNGVPSEKIKTTLDLYQSYYFNNKENEYDFYTKLKLFNLNNGGNLTLQGFDINFDKLSKLKYSEGEYIYPNGSLEDQVKKISDELIIKSYSKSNIIPVFSNKSNSVEFSNTNYKLFYFLKKQDNRNNLYFAVVLDLELIDSKIIIKSKEVYLPHSNTDLKDNFDSFKEKYHYLGLKDLANIRNDSFYVYSEKENLLINKYSSMMVPRLIGNENDKVYLNHEINDNGNFSKTNTGVFKGLVMKSVDKGAGFYIHNNGKYIDMKLAFSDPLSENLPKDDRIQRIEFLRNGVNIECALESEIFKNYLRTFTYNLIKFKATSKKTLLEKLCEIELKN